LNKTGVSGYLDLRPFSFASVVYKNSLVLRDRSRYEGNQSVIRVLALSAGASIRIPAYRKVVNEVESSWPLPERGAKVAAFAERVVDTIQTPQRDVVQSGFECLETVILFLKRAWPLVEWIA